MKAENFNFQSYLARIGFEGVAAADFATLKRMMLCQLFSVPFENLDVQEGKVVSLVPEEIYKKIVERRRGGYCYEVNGLFAMALGSLGVPYQFVAARPMTYPVRRPKTHMAIVATIEGEQWLCDLGFGSYGIREPINLGWINRDIRQGFDTFGLFLNPDGNYLLQSITDDSWKNLYEFNLSRQEWVDFEPANYLNSTHPDSIFVRSLMVVLQTPSGKEVLNGSSYKSVSEGRSQEREVTQEEIALLLQQKFSLGAAQGA
ncbi:arylamine N-acetyltransferase [Chlorobium sp. BLA1]|uniref:arylamine N-acetyltransferase family protein n=1 Tax=Candidatus Chlorobium masyuteum TaxID=2716876 RepID=UPI001424341B|nr:arylamine N-acetyltransferase [Candidatus Chlorobium masyuteum]NHQ61053.1 arylamine N-acetyltransferase [Candidatus Chlorobium masyuteum]